MVLPICPPGPRSSVLVFPLSVLTETGGVSSISPLPPVGPLLITIVPKGTTTTELPLPESEDEAAADDAEESLEDSAFKSVSLPLPLPLPESFDALDDSSEPATCALAAPAARTAASRRRRKDGRTVG